MCLEKEHQRIDIVSAVAFTLFGFRQRNRRF